MTMTRPVRSIVRLAVGVAVIGAIAWVLQPRPILVATAQVSRGTLTTTVSAEGKTRVKDLFVVAAPVDGELARIGVKAGDVVAPSAVVAPIGPVASRPRDPRTRAEANAAVAAARAALQRAEAAEQEALAALAHAKSASETSGRLAREGVVALKDAEHSGHEVE